MEQGFIKLTFEKCLPFVKIIKISGTVFEMCLPPRILTSFKNSKLEFCLPTIKSGRQKKKNLNFAYLPLKLVEYPFETNLKFEFCLPTIKSGGKSIINKNCKMPTYSKMDAENSKENYYSNICKCLPPYLPIFFRTKSKDQVINLVSPYQ